MRADDSITGQVRSVRIVRDGWGIAQVAIASDDRTTPLVGTLLGFEPGDTIEARGAWSMHPQYGRQFKAQSIRRLIPSEADDFITWLARRLPGIGRRRAAAMVERFGSPDAVHRVLLEEPALLVEIPGITSEAAAELSAEYRAIEGERAKMEALIALGLTDRQIARIEAAWGKDALERLRADPYALIEYVDGFGFKRADAVALRMGIPRTHPSRIVAALEYVLEEAEGAGHTYVPAGRLVGIASQLLEIDPSDVRPHIGRLTDGRRAVDRRGWIFRTQIDHAEGAVAHAVVAMVAKRGAR